MSGQPSILRRLNERVLFASLLRGADGSRAEIAKRVGLSAPTVGKVADALIASGLIEEYDDPGSQGVGRPGKLLRLSRSTTPIVAVQIGVRHTRVSALPVSGPVDDRWRVQFATPRRFKSWTDRLGVAAKSLHVARPWAVMVSVPGVTDEAAGRVLLSPNLHWLEKANLADAIGRTWRASHPPVCMVQEIRALAMGHAAAESAAGDFLLVDFGEGVGGAAHLNGRLHEGSLPLSGELGHTPVAGCARPCGCGAIGCMETLLSRGGLIASAGSALPGKVRSWSSLVRHVRKAGVEPWLDESLNSGAIVIAGAMNVLGVRQVIITGSLTELPDVVISRLHDAIERHAMWARFGTVVCRAAPRRRAAGLIAAAINKVLMPAMPWDAHTVSSGGQSNERI